MENPTEASRQKAFALSLEAGTSFVNSHFGLQVDYIYSSYSDRSWRFYLAGSLDRGINSTLFEDNTFMRYGLYWGALHGKRSSFFEFQVGLAQQLYAEGEAGPILPNGHIGYRYEGQKSGFTFRTGFGLLYDGFFIGMGQRF